MMDRRLDPRSIVTPYAFSVHPDLLGMPLATPWQRLGAILVDLVLIGFISQVGLAPLAVLTTLFLFWMAYRKPGRDVLGKLFRIAVGCLGFVVLGVTLLVVFWLRYGDDVRDALEEGEAGIQLPVPVGLTGDSLDEPEGRSVGILDIVEGFRGAIDLQQAADREEAQVLLNDLARGAQDAGLSQAQTRDFLSGLIPEGAVWSSASGEMLDQAVAALGTPAAEEGAPAGPIVSTDSLVSVEPLSQPAADSIARLNQALQRSQEENADLQSTLNRTSQELESRQQDGPLAWMFDFIDELGIGFGWAALYLTFTHAWWNGTSVGKRLFRIRVVMIDKRPLNWWLSFERAGGYAAGFATGLLGFAQIFWDPNRQAIHDKVSETLVIQEGKQPIPGPWIEEGRKQWRRGGYDASQVPLERTSGYR